MNLLHLKVKKILLIDDDVDITTTFKSGLECYGFKVDIYNDPLLALSKFRSGLYDLIISDIRMPNMTGFELCEDKKEGQICESLLSDCF